jgi:hypothetical protein
MGQVANEESGIFVGRRLVLGFDGGCATCSDLARRIKEASEGRLEVLSLHEPMVKKWRKKALGGNASSAPTLFEIHDAKVKAWTGLRMGAQLSRRLGPIVTWRIMQALGEVNASSVINETPAARVASGMSRGQFLKGVSGVVVATSTLSGFGPLIRPAEALEDWQYPSSTSLRQLRGTELQNWANNVRRRSECVWTCGNHGSAMQQSVLQCANSEATVASGGGVRGRAAIHHIANGNRMIVTTFDVRSDKLLTHVQYDQPFRNIKYEVKRWGLGPYGGRLWLERAMINGQQYTDPAAPSLSSRSSRASCPARCQGVCGTRQANLCSSIDVKCATDALAQGIVGCYGAREICKKATNQLTVIACLAAGYLCIDTINSRCCRTTCLVCTPCGSTVNPC